MKKNPLLDFDFLKELDLYPLKEVFIKIIVMSFDENPIEEISGRATQGSVSVDGDSAVRRTCSLTLIANELKINYYYWTLQSKIKIQIGLKNNINDQYDDIIWFPLGVFLITSFNVNQNVNSFTINISGKDKMCLLNGDVAGNIYSKSYDFGTYDEYDSEGNKTTKDYLLKNIITEVVHEFAKEPYENIIVKDLDDTGLELIEYRGSEPLYLIKNVEDDSILLTWDGTVQYYTNDKLTNSIEVQNVDVFDSMLDKISDIQSTPTYVYDSSGEQYTIAKIESGDTVGYQETDLTYTGDLIGSVGDSITSACLDKIVSMLGNYEYFYNLEGQFVFQRKPIYSDVSWNNIVNNEDETYVENSKYISSLSYEFTNNQIITAIQNTPDLSKIKNDFSIWGTRDTISNDQIDIHLRYAIDRKPLCYIDYDQNLFYSSAANISQLSNLSNISNQYKCDWREIIYQMASDYQKYSHITESNYEVIKADKSEIGCINQSFLTVLKNNNPDYYPTGYTGYEQYYTDIYSFWRTLYWPSWAGKIYTVKYFTSSTFSQEISNGIYYYQQCISSNIYNSATDYYIFNAENGYVRTSLTETAFNAAPTNYYILKKVRAVEKFSSSRTYYVEDKESFDSDSYWSVIAKTDPSKLNFWIDFLDTAGSISDFSVYNIGMRPKAESSDDVKSIYIRDTPNILFLDSSLTEDEKSEKIKEKSGYSCVQIPEYVTGHFTVSSQGKTAYDELDNLLYTYTCCPQQIQITCLPIYYLQPNTRIYVYDEKSKINGNYIINKITIPLTYNSTMSITATKVIDELY